MRSSKQIKGKIKHLAKTKDLKPQEVFQMYFFEAELPSRQPLCRRD